MKEEIKEFYKKTSIFTESGPYKEYFKSLPDDIEELSKLVFSQTIHRKRLYFSTLGLGDKQIEKEYPWYNWRLHDDLLLTAPAMTAELFRLDSRGFVRDRKIANKIVITCRYVAVLFASILKAKNIPCRVRSGFAGYFEEEKFVDHWIVQYWNSNESRWINVDADGVYDVDFNQWDMPEDKFEWAAKVWLGVRNGSLDEKKYAQKDTYIGLQMLAITLFYDFHSLMGNEISYLFSPPFLELDGENNMVKNEDYKKIDELASLMLDPDKNFSKLQKIYNENIEYRVLNTPLLGRNDHLEIPNVREAALENIRNKKKES